MSRPRPHHQDRENTVVPANSRFRPRNDVAVNSVSYATRVATTCYAVGITDSESVAFVRPSDRSPLTHVAVMAPEALVICSEPLHSPFPRPIFAANEATRSVTCCAARSHSDPHRFPQIPSALNTRLAEHAQGCTSAWQHSSMRSSRSVLTNHATHVDICVAVQFGNSRLLFALFLLFFLGLAGERQAVWSPQTLPGSREVFCVSRYLRLD